MNWFSYTENVEDNAFVHDSKYLSGLLKTLGHEKEMDSITSFMVEFIDGSFIRFERAGD